MDFTGFIYTNFIDLSENDPLISINTDFTIQQTFVGDQIVKLKLIPNLGVYFANTNFCAKTKAETMTSLQFSRDLYKLNPNVYEL